MASWWTIPILKLIECSMSLAGFSIEISLHCPTNDQQVPSPVDIKCGLLVTVCVWGIIPTIQILAKGLTAPMGLLMYSQVIIPSRSQISVIKSAMEGWFVSINTFLYLHLFPFSFFSNISDSMNLRPPSCKSSSLGWLTTR